MILYLKEEEHVALFLLLGWFVTHHEKVFKKGHGKEEMVIFERMIGNLFLYFSDEMKEKAKEAMLDRFGVNLIIQDGS